MEIRVSAQPNKILRRGEIILVKLKFYDTKKKEISLRHCNFHSNFGDGNGLRIMYPFKISKMWS